MAHRDLAGGFGRSCEPTRYVPANPINFFDFTRKAATSDWRRTVGNHTVAAAIDHDHLTTHAPDKRRYGLHSFSDPSYETPASTSRLSRSNNTFVAKHREPLSRLFTALSCPCSDINHILPSILLTTPIPRRFAYNSCHGSREPSLRLGKVLVQARAGEPVNSTQLATCHIIAHTYAHSRSLWVAVWFKSYLPFSLVKVWPCLGLLPDPAVERCSVR